jgi:hypothetical protein
MLTLGLKTEPAQKTIQVELYLRVENNNKYVRGKTRARQMIEDFVLSQYAMEKPDKNGWQYILTIPYRTQDDPDAAIYEILREAESTADFRHCFIAADVVALDGSDRSW